MMSRLPLLLSVSLSLMVTACASTPPTDSVQNNSDSETTSETSDSETPSDGENAAPIAQQNSQTKSSESKPKPDHRVKVYFPKEPESYNNFEYVEPVWRYTESTGVAQFAIAQLIDGPTESEQQKGLINPIELRGESNCGEDFQVKIEDEIAQLKFCRDVVSAGVGDDARITSALNSTLKQFSTVSDVVLLTREGNCLGDMSGENFCLEKIDSTQALTTDSPITLTGIGNINAGMTIEEATETTGMEFVQRASGGEEYGCLYYTVKGLEDVDLMVTEGNIARVDVSNSNIETVSGAKLGDTEAEIRSLYEGKIEEEPHPYIEGGKYLIYVPENESNANYRVYFETDETGKVILIRSGKLPEVSYIEGCV